MTKIFCSALISQLPLTSPFLPPPANLRRLYLYRLDEVVDVGRIRKVFRIDDRMSQRIGGSEADRSAALRMKDDRQDGDGVAAVVWLQELVPDLTNVVKVDKNTKRVSHLKVSYLKSEVIRKAFF
jgi:hypothetical protein